MSSPRPILKRSETAQPMSSVHRYPRPSSSMISHHGVHFPPSPSLTRTFSAYSPSTYDRSPIVVTPNTCALPERGCPGRTYTLDDPALPAPSSLNWRSAASYGRHLHPRAVGLGYRQPSPDEDLDYDDDDESQRTPTHTFPVLPSLIPDLSSESEESDGFTSPPSEPAQYSMSTAYYSPSHSYPISAPSHPPIPYAPFRPHMPYSNEIQQSYFSGPPNALSFLPHPPSPPDEAKARRKKQRDREGKHQRKISDGSYKSLSVCKALANCALNEADNGCLGGF